MHHGESIGARGLRGRRAGFSLAEILIAIGVLGIGLLLVAALFPLGMEQTRTAMVQTVVPLVADGAFGTMRLLCEETRPREWPDPAAPGGRRQFVLRDEMQKTASVLVDGRRLPNLTDAILLPASGNLRVAPSLNAQLAVAGLRSYPAASGSAASTPYGWIVLFWNPPGVDGAARIDRLELVFLICRGDADPPMWITARRDADDPRVLYIVGDVRGVYGATAVADRLGAGPSLVWANRITGEIRLMTVTAVDAAGAVVRLEEPAPFAAAGDVELWAVPGDRATGLSPVVSGGLARRTLLPVG